MNKVIAITKTGQRVLTARETAEKKNWWITHYLEVEVLSQTITANRVRQEPEPGHILQDSGASFYRIVKSEKVLICRVCLEKAKYRIGNLFYCKKHYKHLTFTKPIRREFILPKCISSSYGGLGLKTKDGCNVNFIHEPEFTYNNQSKENQVTVNALKDIKYGSS